jgi:TonB family protein
MTSPSAGAGSGTLDLSALDKAMAGSGTGTRGTGGAAGAGGSGGTAGGVTGSGTGGGVPGSAITGPGYTVLWDQPEASKGREVLKAVTPSVPAWVGKQGMTLSVTVSFTLGADGVLSGVTVEKSSGYADVDSEVVRAIRQWRFSTAPGAGPVRGLIPYKITSR